MKEGFFYVLLIFRAFPSPAAAPAGQTTQTVQRSDTLERDLNALHNLAEHTDLDASTLAAYNAQQNAQQGPEAQISQQQQEQQQKVQQQQLQEAWQEHRQKGGGVGPVSDATGEGRGANIADVGASAVGEGFGQEGKVPGVGLSSTHGKNTAGA
jgi:hypothetical protein